MRYNYNRDSMFNQEYRHTTKTVDLNRLQTVDEPCRHPVDLRSRYLERGKRWQRCLICGAVRFGCGPWDSERSLQTVEQDR